MRLTELDASFLKYTPYEDTWTEIKDGVEKQVTGTRQAWRRVDTLAEADGVSFLCPKCWVKNDGPVGTHTCICWFVGKVPEDLWPGPGRWNPQGTSLEDLTFVGPGAFSIKVGEDWHGYLEQGSLRLD